MTRKGRRLTMIGLGVATLGFAAGLVLYVLQGQASFFRSPSDVAQLGLQPGTRFRLGGLVREGSVERGTGQAIRFDVTDGNATLPVRFEGLLPDLFREGQGVIADGVLEAGSVFRATNVLARHDENYVPRELAESLRAQGLWKPGEPLPRARTPDPK